MPARQRPPFSWASATLTLALCSAGFGCSEPPSYLVRWKLVDEAGLADPNQAAELTSVKQCADVGVSRIRVTTWRQDDSILDRREYACFPGAFESGDAVEVPALPDGEYIVEVEGLRRTGEPWACIVDPDAAEQDPCVAFAEASVTVAEGTLPTVEVALLQPRQCDDGVDNDRDGRVDSKDPACILDPEGLESADASVTLFQISVSFLDNPAVEPANVSVDALALAVDDVPLAEVTASELDTSQWPFRLPLQTESYEPGVHVFSLVGVDGSGDPVTSAFEVEFSVSEQSAGFVLETFDFGDEQFLEPIVEPFSASLALLLDASDSTGPACKLGGSLDGTPISIEQTWFRVTDEGEQALDAAALGLTGSASGGAITPVDEAGGWISFACPTSTVASVPLTWGNYAIEIEGKIAGVACFSSEGAQPLAPVGQSGAQSINLTRIVDDQGVPPAGCEECSQDSDCSGQICDAGICKDKLP